MFSANTEIAKYKKQRQIYGLKVNSTADPGSIRAPHFDSPSLSVSGDDWVQSQSTKAWALLGAAYPKN